MTAVSGRTEEEGGEGIGRRELVSLAQCVCVCVAAGRGNEEEGSRDGDRALWRLGLGGLGGPA